MKEDIKRLKTLKRDIKNHLIRDFSETGELWMNVILKIINYEFRKVGV